jgi:hypothetical protein
MKDYRMRVSPEFKCMLDNVIKSQKKKKKDTSYREITEELSLKLHSKKIKLEDILL